MKLYQPPLPWRLKNSSRQICVSINFDHQLSVKILGFTPEFDHWLAKEDKLE